jgi:hypothetical protein
MLEAKDDFDIAPSTPKFSSLLLEEHIDQPFLATSVNEAKSVILDSNITSKHQTKDTPL